MNAVEFVKLVGLAESKRIVSDNETKGLYRHLNVCHIDLLELEHLVESYELVESWGGLEDAKLYDFDSFKDKPNSAGYKLMQAIVDVEKCQ